ncbi:hypothetical protein ALC62_14980, partial [Cyphomyrmex costatus]
NQTVMGDRYSKQLRQLYRELIQKRPQIASNRHKVILLHGNVRLHVVKEIKEALLQLEWDVLRAKFKVTSGAVRHSLHPAAVRADAAESPPWGNTFSRRFLPSSPISQLCRRRDGPHAAIRSPPRERQFNLAWAEINRRSRRSISPARIRTKRIMFIFRQLVAAGARKPSPASCFDLGECALNVNEDASFFMTNAARKCFIARQSRLTPTFVSTAVFCACPFPRTSEIRNARGLRRETTTTVAGTPSNECSLQRDRRPRPLEILSSSAVNREVGSFASSEVNRALKAATTFSSAGECRGKWRTRRTGDDYVRPLARVNHISKRTDDIKTGINVKNLVQHYVVSCLTPDLAGKGSYKARAFEISFVQRDVRYRDFLFTRIFFLIRDAGPFPILRDRGRCEKAIVLDRLEMGGCTRNITTALILQFVVFLLIQDSMSPDDTPFRESSARDDMHDGPETGCTLVGPSKYSFSKSHIISNSCGPFSRCKNIIK